MNPSLTHSLLPAFMLSGMALFITTTATAAQSPVAFKQDYQQDIHYFTKHRGSITEELYASQAAINAAKQDKPLPVGTYIMMEDFRSGELYRYVAMEKVAGYGDTRNGSSNTGDWAFQTFSPDGEINHNEDISRCHSCHSSQESNDYVFSYQQLKETKSE